MKPRNGFIVSIFFLLLITPFSTQAQDRNCRKMDVTVDVTPAQNGKGGVVTVSTTNNDLKFTLHLLGAGSGNKTERMKITSGKIENVPVGSYDLIIQSKTRGYCSETRTVTVN
ncbi:MAG: hypothetical protein WDO15_17620 [Bacteroidota bacterium]